MIIKGDGINKGCLKGMEDVIRNDIEKAYNLIEKANGDIFNIWINHVLFTWQWWLALTLAVIPWVFWILFRKKESTYRLLCAGFFVVIFALISDFVGVTLGAWHYFYEVSPFLPAFQPWDLTLLPVSVMFMLQYKPNSNPYLKAVVFAGITAFIAEPLAQWVGFYEPKHWEHIYSFLVLTVIYLIAHYINNREEFAKV